MTKYFFCDKCDGCGTYEGGPTYMFTKCEACAGHGVVLTEGLKILTPEQVIEVKGLLNE